MRARTARCCSSCSACSRLETCTRTRVHVPPAPLMSRPRSQARVVRVTVHSQSMGVTAWHCAASFANSRGSSARMRLLARCVSRCATLRSATLRTCTRNARGGRVQSLRACLGQLVVMSLHGPCADSVIDAVLRLDDTAQAQLASLAEAAGEGGGGEEADAYDAARAHPEPDHAAYVNARGAIENEDTLVGRARQPVAIKAPIVAATSSLYVYACAPRCCSANSGLRWTSRIARRAVASVCWNPKSRS